MEIERRVESRHTELVVEEDGARVAELTWLDVGEGRILIDHTWVDPRLRGQGVAARLVAAAVEHARAAGLKVLPGCSYARKVFDDRPDYADVRAG